MLTELHAYRYQAERFFRQPDSALQWLGCLLRAGKLGAAKSGGRKGSCKNDESAEIHGLLGATGHRSLRRVARAETLGGGQPLFSQNISESPLTRPPLTNLAGPSAV